MGNEGQPLQLTNTYPANSSQSETCTCGYMLSSYQNVPWFVKLQTICVFF